MADARQQVMVEVEAVGFVGPRVTLAGGHHCLEALAPICGDGVEPQSRRGRHSPRLQRRDQLLAGATGREQVGAGGAEVQAPGATGADRVPAVGLAVDATLHAGAPRLRRLGHLALLPTAAAAAELTYG
jgi:hypothetical protein